MPIRFDMKRDPTAGLVPEGVHRFVVEHVEEKNGSKGPFLNMRLRIYVRGVKWVSGVFEVLSTSPDAKFKVDQFFDAVGASEEGVAGEAWFLNKTGWAKFIHKPDNDGVLRTKVQSYLTTEQAEELIAKMGEEDDLPTTPMAETPASTPRQTPRGRRAAVAEMADNGEAPF